MTTLAASGSVTAHRRDDVPDPEAAFLTLVAATEGIGCPVHAVGVVASHLSGPVSAAPPDWHPRQRTQGVASRRSLERLIERAAGIGSVQDAECRCVEGSHTNPLWVVVPSISPETCIARPPRDSDAVLRAMFSGDPDAGIPALDGRLDALLTLADQARAVAGGELQAGIADAVRTLAETLVGLTRWWQISPYESAYAWPTTWRYSGPSIRANSFLSNPDIAARIMRRLVEGR